MYKDIRDSIGQELFTVLQKGVPVTKVWMLYPGYLVTKVWMMDLCYREYSPGDQYIVRLPGRYDCVADQLPSPTCQAVVL